MPIGSFSAPPDGRSMQVITLIVDGERAIASFWTCVAGFVLCATWALFQQERREEPQARLRP
jgi:bacteriorhodopsin